MKEKTEKMEEKKEKMEKKKRRNQKKRTELWSRWVLREPPFQRLLQD